MYVYINDKLYETTENWEWERDNQRLTPRIRSSSHRDGWIDAVVAGWTGSCDDKTVTDSDNPYEMFSFSAIFRALEEWGDVYWSLREY